MACGCCQQGPTHVLAQQEQKQDKQLQHQSLPVLAKQQQQPTLTLMQRTLATAALSAW